MGGLVNHSMTCALAAMHAAIQRLERENALKMNIDFIIVFCHFDDYPKQSSKWLSPKSISQFLK